MGAFADCCEELGHKFHDPVLAKIANEARKASAHMTIVVPGDGPPGGGVISFDGRTGVVLPQSGDYSAYYDTLGAAAAAQAAAEAASDPVGSAATAQANAINSAATAAALLYQNQGPQPSGNAATDTAAVQAVFTAANAAGTPAIITWPGTYLINSTLTMSSDCVFGSRTVFQATAALAGGILAQTPQTPELPNSWTSFTNGIFDSNGYATTAFWARYFGKLYWFGSPGFGNSGSVGNPGNDLIIGDTGAAAASQGFKIFGFATFFRSTGSVQPGSSCIYNEACTDCYIRGGGSGQETAIWNYYHNGDCVFSDTHFSNAAFLQGYRNDSKGSQRYVSCIADSYAPKAHTTCGAASTASSTITDTTIQASHQGLPLLTTAQLTTTGTGATQLQFAAAPPLFIATGWTVTGPGLTGTWTISSIAGNNINITGGTGAPTGGVYTLNSNLLPQGSYVGTVTVGTSFVLVNNVGTAVLPLATFAATTLYLAAVGFNLQDGSNSGTQLEGGYALLNQSVTNVVDQGYYAIVVGPKTQLGITSFSANAQSPTCRFISPISGDLSVTTWGQLYANNSINSVNVNNIPPPPPNLNLAPNPCFNVSQTGSATTSLVLLGNLTTPATTGVTATQLQFAATPNTAIQAGWTVTGPGLTGNWTVASVVGNNINLNSPANGSAPTGGQYVITSTTIPAVGEICSGSGIVAGTGGAIAQVTAVSAISGGTYTVTLGAVAGSTIAVSAANTYSFYGSVLSAPSASVYQFFGLGIQYTPVATGTVRMEIKGVLWQVGASSNVNVVGRYSTVAANAVPTNGEVATGVGSAFQEGPINLTTSVTLARYAFYCLDVRFLAADVGIPIWIDLAAEASGATALMIESATVTITET